MKHHKTKREKMNKKVIDVRCNPTTHSSPRSWYDGHNLYFNGGGQTEPTIANLCQDLTKIGPSFCGIFGGIFYFNTQLICIKYIIYIYYIYINIY